MKQKDKSTLLMTSAAFLSLSACSGYSHVEESLAQCQVDANGPWGMTFRTNYLDGQPSVNGDASYREFILTCMPAKGWNFVQPTLASEPDPCWLEDQQGGLPDANVDDAGCYERQ